MAVKKLDWEKYKETARQVVTEGVVLLKNDDRALPFLQGTKVSVFGRGQDNYYKSGLGSGGMVNVEHVVSIPEGLAESGVVELNEDLRKVYEKWEEENPVDQGAGWGNEPFSQAEMPVTPELCAQAAAVSDAALIVIGRTGGEDRDIEDAAGSYRLTDIENDMIREVCAAFKRVTVVMNVGAPMDLSFIKMYNPAAVAFVWQGGMIGGSGVADVLTGKVSPSGKLTDTLAESVADYPSAPFFGDRFQNKYAEDIYVGYRYFETFAKDKVLYPFGFGLSYTNFSVEATESKVDTDAFCAHLAVRVTNTGSVAGKEVVQIYAGPGQGKVKNPAVRLLSYEKTRTLAPGESQDLSIEIDIRDLAVYDDAGLTGNPFCYVLEAGVYDIFLGTDSRNVWSVAKVDIAETTVTRKLSQAYAPTLAFDRMVPVTGEDGSVTVGWEATPLGSGEEALHINNFFRGDIAGERIKNISFRDVVSKHRSLDDFVYDLSDYDLSCIVCGEGMGSPRVTPGTASGFGAVSDELAQLKLPAVCCADGPSGIRMDCGTKAFSLPNGITLACSFNDELVEELYAFIGMELLANRIDCLLAPGMNIHRHPLNGRNFEYFSEDPVVTGRMATAVCKGLKKQGVYAVPKHFTGNNQESGRRTQDSVISERALREIYLKGFEMVVKSGYCNVIMTSYGIVNGIRTTESYDLTTRILREEWGFNGVVMTDWWANISSQPDFVLTEGFEYMVGSQNDVFMVIPRASDNELVLSSMEILKRGDERSRTYRANLRRAAANICRFVKKTEAMKRLAQKEDFPTIDAFDKPILLEPSTVEILNRPKDDEAEEFLNLEYIDVEKEFSHELTYKESKKGSNFVFPLNMKLSGTFEFALTASSELSELAQVPMSVFINGTPIGVLTFHGTGGKPERLSFNMISYGRTSLMRVYVGGNGVKLLKMEMNYVSSELKLKL